MINVNELRIRNLLHTGDSEVYRVDAINGARSAIHCSNINGDPEDTAGGVVSCFQRIPLTAEWFQKFGYNGNVIPIPVERESEFRAEIIFDHLGDGKTFLVISTPDSDFFRVGEEIQFVHELQNRFQSLTKKELQTEQINQ